MAFSDVVDMEMIMGNKVYAEWLRNGRPTLTFEDYVSLRRSDNGYRPVEDVLDTL